METRLDPDILEKFVCLEPDVGEELLPLYPESLSPEDRKLFELHRQGCEYCQERWKLWQVTGIPLRIQAILKRTQLLFAERHYEDAVAQCNNVIELKAQVLDTREGQELFHFEASPSLTAARIKNEDIMPYLDPEIEVLAAAKKSVSLPVSLEYAEGKVKGKFSAAGRFVFFELLEHSSEFKSGVVLVGKILHPKTMFKTWTLFQEKKKLRLGTIADLFGSAEFPDIVSSLRTFSVYPV